MLFQLKSYRCAQLCTLIYPVVHGMRTLLSYLLCYELRCHLQHSQLAKNPSEHSVWFTCTVKLAECEQRKRKACWWLLCIGEAGQELGMDVCSPECFIHQLRHSTMDFTHSSHCRGRLLGNFQFFSFLSYLSGILWEETFAPLSFVH